MSYSTAVLADSVSESGVRLTTLQVTFPRFILAEVNTHRMLSRNSASSRAIPPEKQIASVRASAFVPETFNQRVTGMGVGEALGTDEQEAARAVWLEAAASACSAAAQLLSYDVDKSRINRLLEPFLWHTAIISATEWSNFFALRDHSAAQPEFQITARLMRQAMGQSKPVLRFPGEWHLPLVEDREHQAANIDRDPDRRLAMISAGRCARVSYDKHADAEPIDKTLERAQKLAGSGHFSPFEHCAMALRGEHFEGNFRGWRQLRKMLPGEYDASQLAAYGGASVKMP